MRKIAVWRIGTNIEHYLNKAQDIYTKFSMNKFIIKESSTSKYIFESIDNKNIIFEYDISKTTISQFIRTLLYLNILKCDNSNEKIFELKKIYSFNENLDYKFNENIKKVIMNYLTSKDFEEQINIYSSIINNKDIENDEDNYSKLKQYESEISFLNSFFIVLLRKIKNLSEKEITKLLYIEKNDVIEIEKYYNIIDFDFSKQNKDIEKLQKVIMNYFEITDEEINNVKGIKKIKNSEIVIKDDSIFDNLELQISKKSYYDTKIKSSINSFGCLLLILKQDRSNLFIPIYQRKYKWTQEIVLKLFEDIKTIDYYHYMGDLLVNESEEISSTKIWKVIDGQQRITSLIIILKALYDYKVEINYPVDKLSSKLFNHENNHDAKIISCFKQLSSSDDYSDFKKLINDEFNDIYFKRSLIYKNYISVFKEFKNFNNDELNRYTENLLLKVIFTQTIDKVNNEYQLFENMNTKKVELETIELMKNFIMMHIDTPYLNNDKELSDFFTEKIMNKFIVNSKRNISSKIDNFINAYIQIQKYDPLIGSYLKKQISDVKNNKNDIYSLFKELIKFEINKYSSNGKLNEDQYKNLIRKLSKSIEFFIEFTENTKFTNNQSIFNGIADILFMLQGRKIYIPLIWYLIEKFYDREKNIISNLKKLRELLFSIEDYEVKFQVVLYRGQSLGLKMRKILDRISEIDVVDLTSEKLRDIFNSEELLSNLKLPNIDIFKDKLGQPITASNLVVKILYRIDFYLSNNRSLMIRKEHTNSFNATPSSREHIMPQVIDKWREDLKNLNVDVEHNATLHLLGNSLKLDNSLNVEASNSRWKDKKAKYIRESNLLNSTQYKGYILEDNVILMDLSSISQWDFEFIKKRNEQLINILVDIYK